MATLPTDRSVIRRDGAAGDEALEDLARARGVARLRRQRGTRDVWSPALIRHRPPRMVARRGLREPDVAGITRKLTALERADESPRGRTAFRARY